MLHKHERTLDCISCFFFCFKDKNAEKQNFTPFSSFWCFGVFSFPISTLYKDSYSWGKSSRRDGNRFRYGNDLGPRKVGGSLCTRSSLRLQKELSTNSRQVVYEIQTTFKNDGSDGKESTFNVEDLGLTLVSGRSPGEQNGKPVQYSCLGNPMDRGAWWAKWSCKESDMTELLTLTHSGFHLENPIVPGNFTWD